MRDDLEAASAGTNHDAKVQISAELVEWAELIFVMEKFHRGRLQRKFRSDLKGKRLVCLDIPDNYAFTDPVLNSRQVAKSNLSARRFPSSSRFSSLTRSCV